MSEAKRNIEAIEGILQEKSLLGDSVADVSGDDSDVGRGRGTENGHSRSRVNWSSSVTSIDRGLASGEGTLPEAEVQALQREQDEEDKKMGLSKRDALAKRADELLHGKQHRATIYMAAPVRPGAADAADAAERAGGHGAREALTRAEQAKKKERLASDGMTSFQRRNLTLDIQTDAHGAVIPSDDQAAATYGMRRRRLDEAQTAAEQAISSTVGGQWKGKGKDPRGSPRGGGKAASTPLPKRRRRVDASVVDDTSVVMGPDTLAGEAHALDARTGGLTMSRDAMAVEGATEGATVDPYLLRLRAYRESHRELFGTGTKKGDEEQDDEDEEKQGYTRARVEKCCCQLNPRRCRLHSGALRERRANRAAKVAQYYDDICRLYVGDERKVLSIYGEENEANADRNGPGAHGGNVSRKRGLTFRLQEDAEEEDAASVAATNDAIPDRIKRLSNRNIPVSTLVGPRSLPASYGIPLTDRDSMSLYAHLDPSLHSSLPPRTRYTLKSHNRAAQMMDNAGMESKDGQPNTFDTCLAKYEFPSVYDSHTSAAYGAIGDRVATGAVSDMNITSAMRMPISAVHNRQTESNMMRHPPSTGVRTQTLLDECLRARLGVMSLWQSYRPRTAHADTTTLTA